MRKSAHNLMSNLSNGHLNCSNSSAPARLPRQYPWGPEPQTPELDKPTLYGLSSTVLYRYAILSVGALL